MNECNPKIDSVVNISLGWGNYKAYCNIIQICSGITRGRGLIGELSCMFHSLHISPAWDLVSGVITITMYLKRNGDSVFILFNFNFILLMYVYCRNAYLIQDCLSKHAPSFSCPLIVLDS